MEARTKASRLEKRTTWNISSKEKGSTWNILWTDLFPIQLQDVEGVEVSRYSPIHQGFELTLSIGTQADNLAVQHGISGFQCPGNLLGQRDESVVDIALCVRQACTAGHGCTPAHGNHLA
jgi:hypothetical protein